MLLVVLAVWVLGGLALALVLGGVVLAADLHQESEGLGTPVRAGAAPAPLGESVPC